MTINLHSIFLECLVACVSLTFHRSSGINLIKSQNQASLLGTAGIFVGYNSSSKAYKVYQPQTRKIIVSRDVFFNEEEKWNWEQTKETSTSKQKSSLTSQTREEQASEQWQEELEDDLPTRGARQLHDIYQRCNVAICEPAGYEEAIKDQKWQKAMEEELSMIKKEQNLGAS